GLAAGASPLEVASAYVSLCEELDRELAAAPTEALRRRCLEARAEIDSAYQHCAAAPLASEAPVPNPPFVRILADPDPPAHRRRNRRRPLRSLGAVAALAVFAAAGSLGYVWWSDPEQLAFLQRYLPLSPDPELVDAQTSAEYLRRRVAEERHDIERRVEEADQRLAHLQTEATAA